MLGNGDGSFRKQYDARTNPRVGLVADFNSDGNLDLAVANFLDNNLSILLGNGDGTFQTHVNYPAGTNPNALAGGDLNGDGKLDLVTVNYTSNNVSVLAGNGDGTFQSHVDFGAGSGPAQLAIGDFNTDGRLDIVTANNLDNTVSVLLQTTESTLTLESSFSRKTDRHNSFDVPLPGVEDRSDNKRFVIGFTFNNEVTGADSASTSRGTIGSVSVDPADSHTLLVTFNGQTCNQQEVTLTLTNVHDTLGNTLASAETSGCFLIGDVNGDGHVGNGDIGNIQGHLGETTDSTNFRDDINADGRINNQDVQAARSHRGESLP